MKIKLIKIILSQWMLALMVVLMWGTISFASPMERPSLEDGVTEESVSGMKQLKEKTEGHAEPQEDSTVILEIEEGQQVLLLGKDGDDWFRIMYQEQVMYVHTDYLEELTPDQELKEEMGELESVRAAEAEKDVTVRKEILRKRIMGVIIVLLIAAIFIAGAVSVLKPKKEL